MTDQPQGPEWWQASDRRWYPPEQHPNYEAPPPPSGQRPRGEVKVGLIALVIVVLAAAGITGYLVWPSPAPSQNQTEQPAPPSGPIAQPAPASAPTAQPAPSAALIPPTSRYFKTQIGRICEVTAQRVACQSCAPGDALPARQTCTDAMPGIAFNTAGTLDDNPGIVGSSSDVQQLSDGQTEHANGWTIVSDSAWTRFINDATGHGMALAAQNNYAI
jgi:hypothetical protein